MDDTKNNYILIPFVLKFENISYFLILNDYKSVENQKRNYFVKYLT